MVAGEKKDVINLLSCEQSKYIIIKNFNKISQNVQKNYFLTNIIFENNKNFNVIFIQKLFWSIIHIISNSTSEKMIL